MDPCIPVYMQLDKKPNRTPDIFRAQLPIPFHQLPIRDQEERYLIIMEIEARTRVLEAQLKEVYGVDSKEIGLGAYNRVPSLEGREYNLLEALFDYANLKQRFFEVIGSGKGDGYYRDGQAFWGNVKDSVVDEINRRERIM